MDQDQMMRVSELISRMPIKLHRRTVEDWIKRGLIKMRPGGSTPVGERVKLKAQKIGAHWYTTINDYHDFISELNAVDEYA